METKKKLQLRIGGKYKDQNGDVVTIKCASNFEEYPWQGDCCTYTDDGHQDVSIQNNVNDLIEEIITMKTMSELDELNVVALRTMARETFGGASWIASASRSDLCTALTTGKVREMMNDDAIDVEIIQPKPKEPQSHMNGNISPLALAIESAIKNTMGDMNQGDIKGLTKKVNWLEANFETFKEEQVVRTEVVIKRDFNEEITLGAQHQNFPILLKLMSIHKMNILLVGETGSGKSEGCKFAADSLNLKFYPMSICKQTTKADLMGYLNPFDGKIIRSALRIAYEDGGVCCLDEIDKGNDNVMAVLNSLSSNGGCTFPDGYVHRHKDFILVATANTHGTGGNRRYCGSNQLDSSTLARYATLNWDYDELLELQISCNQKWTRRVQALRKASVEMESDLIISPRVSIMGGQMIDQQGFTFEEAEDIWIFASVDSDTKMKIRNSAS